MNSNKPIKEIRLGAIRASIWKNQKEDKTNYNIKITKSYKQDENWKETTNFSKTDLVLVTKVADLAHTYIYQNG